MKLKWWRHSVPDKWKREFSFLWQGKFSAGSDTGFYLRKMRNILEDGERWHAEQKQRQR